MRLMICVLLLAMGPALAQGQDPRSRMGELELVGTDIPMGSRAGRIEAVDWAGGRIRLHGTWLQLSDAARDSLSKSRGRYSSLEGKVAVYWPGRGDNAGTVKDIYLTETRQ